MLACVAGIAVAIFGKFSLDVVKALNAPKPPTDWSNPTGRGHARAAEPWDFQPPNESQR
jgi:hypothetical protein